MTKTYSEQRQDALYAAARAFRRIAGQILDDVSDPVELRSVTTCAWAHEAARKTAERANDFENQGHEEGIASAYKEAAIRRSRDTYSASIDAFEARIRQARTPVV